MFICFAVQCSVAEFDNCGRGFKIAMGASGGELGGPTRRVTCKS